MLGAACLCLLFLSGWVLYSKVTVPSPQKFCAGVGLGGPPANSVDEAFGAWLATEVDQPPRSAWHRDGNTYTNQAFHASPGALHSVEVRQGGLDFANYSTLAPDEWSVQGGCV